jgi:hypothetical protein
MKIPMKMLLGCMALALCSCAGTTQFMPYSGTQQKWPTAPGAFVSNELAVPVYHGLPPRPYRVLGELATEKMQGWRMDVKSQTLEIAVEEAQKLGADAVIVLNSDSAVTGAVTTAHVIGKSAFATTTPYQTGYARVAAIKFL